MTLHGGLSAGIYDVATSWLLDVIRKPGFWLNFGTSRSMSVTFVRPAMEGEMLRMETEVRLGMSSKLYFITDCSQIVHAGKRLCLLKAVLMREKDRAIISTCEHQKYNTDADSPKV